MSPTLGWEAPHPMLVKRDGEKPVRGEGQTVEAWSQGYMVGSILIMGLITIANMRKGVILHKLILLELLCGVWHGIFIFFEGKVYGWVLSTTALGLYTSWSLHNVIAWMKIKPFLSRPASLVFIITVILIQPYWILETYANFTYFNQINEVFNHTRPMEALCRDPWWIYTTVTLFYSIKTRYGFGMKEIIRISPRFGVMLFAMVLSIVFLTLDTLAVTNALKLGLPTGINPFWKLSYVFKCLTDTVILDDFKTSLDRLRAFKFSRAHSHGEDQTRGVLPNAGGRQAVSEAEKNRMRQRVTETTDPFDAPTSSDADSTPPIPLEDKYFPPEPPDSYVQPVTRKSKMPWARSKLR